MAEFIGERAWQSTPIEDCGHPRFRVIMYGVEAGAVRCLTPGCEQRYRVTSRASRIKIRCCGNDCTLVRGPCDMMIKELWGDTVAGAYRKRIAGGELLMTLETAPYNTVLLTPIAGPSGRRW